MWKYKEEYGGRILTQLKRLGCSLDWNREVFTMDADRAKAVTEGFCRFHEVSALIRDLDNEHENRRPA